MQLKEEYKKKARTNDDVLYEISKSFVNPVSTVKLWFYRNSNKITSPIVLQILSKHFNVPVEELIK